MNSRRLAESVAQTGHGGTTTANDAELAVRRRYDVPYEHPALEAWTLRRAADGAPFAPRFMAYSGMGGPAATSERLALLQDIGSDAFLIACDLPSQLGLDPTHRLSRAQVGRAGLSCATLSDCVRACADLDLSRVDSLGMLANSVGPVGLGMVLATLEQRGASNVKIMMQNDPLKEFTARGTEIHDVENAVRVACDCVAYTIDEGLDGWPLTVCSNHYDVAGTGPVLALAIALGNAIAYVDELLERGYEIGDVHRSLMFFFNERSDFFAGASLFRMSRVLWSEILSDRYHLPLEAQVPATIMGYSHALESVDEPLVNVARFAISAASAMFGGVDYLCAASYDEALRIPSADAAALAIRTMQVVGLEHGVMESVDPLAGSVKLQDVDRQIYAQVRAELDELIERGGAIECVRNGHIAQRINERRGTRERQIEAGERTWVGVNAFRAPARQPLFAGRSTSAIDLDAVEVAARERLERLVRRRDPTEVRRRLESVADAAAGRANLVPPTLHALQSDATLEEITVATSRGFELAARAG